MASFRAKLTAAFLAVYLIWGSTYLAIRVAEETLPPFLMAGSRFVVAGFVLFLWTRLRGGSRVSISRKAWGAAFVVGGLMLLGGHGAVVWAEQWVPSGLVSLLVGTVPLWMAFSDWLWNRTKLRARVGAGLVLGFAGVVLLVGGIEGLGAGSVDVGGAAIVVLGAFLWANGSLYSRSSRLPSLPLLATAMEMIAGGSLLLLASLIRGEWGMINLQTVSARSMLAWVYLVVFGALVAFTCYVWLLKVTSTSRASTYAYVNPIVAMLLGWTLANEPLTFRSMLAAGLILASVAITTAFSTRDTS